MTETSSPPSRPWDKRGQEGSYDTIVIGSGMGGMTTAAMLADFGERVLVLEQHYVPGGYTHTFKRPGYEWDVGVHAIGEVTEHTMTGRLLRHLTRGGLKWSSLGPVYDEFYFPDDFRIDFPDNPHQFASNLKEAFPHEATAVDAYLDEVRDVAKAMRNHYLARVGSAGASWISEGLLARKARHHFNRRTEAVVAGLTSDPKLRALFTAQWGYYGSTPSRSSFAMQALVVKHFLHGGYYPEGGSSQIARHLLQTVADAGGWTRVSTDVEQIMVEKGKAVGVRLKGGEEIRAKRIVSAAGILSTVQRLLPEEYSQTRWCQEVETLAPAPAHVCLYLGFKGDIRAAGAGSANKWFYDTWDMEIDTWSVSPEARPPHADILYCSFPSLKDPLHDPGPEQRHTGEVVTFVPWESFQTWSQTRWHKRGADYETFKAELSERLLDQLLTRLPGLRSMVDHVELSTPLSTENFCRPVRGSIYGIEPTPERFGCKWLRPKSTVGNLYFSGSDVSAVGVIGAMMGGVLCATAARPLATANLLRSLN